jgi:hypothetical protein
MTMDSLHAINPQVWFAMYLVWVIFGYLFIFKFKFWKISTYVDMMANLGYLVTALVSAVLVILLWPISHVVTMPLLAWVLRREKKKLAVAKERFQKLLEE